MRRGGANQNFGLSSRRAVTFVWGVADVASFEETVARSEWCEIAVGAGGLELDLLTAKGPRNLKVEMHSVSAMRQHWRYS